MKFVIAAKLNIFQDLFTRLRSASAARPDSRDTNTVSSTEGSSPHHEPSVRSFFDLTSTVDISLSWRYVGDLPAQEVEGYQTGDARVAWRPHRGIEFSVSGQNLLQPHHAEFGGDPGPLVGIKRSVYGTVTFSR